MSNKISSNNSISQNWAVAKQDDSKISPQELENIIQAAKADGVTDKEFIEAKNICDLAHAEELMTMPAYREAMTAPAGQADVNAFQNNRLAQNRHASAKKLAEAITQGWKADATAEEEK